MRFDVVLSVFIHPCSEKRRRAQYSRRVDASVRGVSRMSLRLLCENVDSAKIKVPFYMAMAILFI